MNSFSSNEAQPRSGKTRVIYVALEQMFVGEKSRRTFASQAKQKSFSLRLRGRTGYISFVAFVLSDCGRSVPLLLYEVCGRLVHKASLQSSGRAGAGLHSLTAMRSELFGAVHFLFGPRLNLYIHAAFAVYGNL